MTLQHLPTFSGLALALFGPMFITIFAGKFFAEPEGLLAGLAAQGGLWVLCGLVLLIAMGLEKVPARSIGFRKFNFTSIVWAIALFLISLFVTSPALMWAAKNVLGSGFDTGIEKLRALPVWYLLIAVVTAGVVEEILYRGYAFGRLAELIGNRWVASAIVVIVFGLVHVPFWGFGASLAMTIGGVVPMAFYVWKGDLYALMISHAMIDAMGLIVGPRFLYPSA